MVLKNILEEQVFASLDKVMGDGGFCGCERCRLDAAAIALNSLPPHYIATEKGELFSKVERLTFQYDADVLVAIGKGMQTVRQNPRHS